ncbi:MAG: TolC family protein [Candidatus Aminicenantes bacterium]|nr:TolC family protein [Candidatus Aminicenantes bacterium]
MSTTRKRRFISLIAAIVGIAAVGAAAPQELSMTLEECILKALKNNLNVAAEVLGPAMARTSVTKAAEKFYPVLGLGYSRENTNSASYSYIDAAEQITTNYNDASTRIELLLPMGTELSASFFSYKTDTNRNFQTINPRYGSTLLLGFRQPLLKDFGLNVNRREILVARNNRDISEHQLRTVLIQTIYQVEEAYWSLVHSIEYLKAKQQSLDLARDLLSKNQKEEEVGMIAPIEILSAQAEVATREADILQARVMVSNSQDSLRTLMNLESEQVNAAATVIPVDTPASGKKDVSLEESMALARENRPDLLADQVDLDTKEIDVGYYRNQLLPSLDLQASYWSPGISGTQILYLDNDPLTGVVVGSIPGSSSNSIRDALKFRYKNWSVGLTLTLPLSSLLTRSDYVLAKAGREQAALKLQHQEQQIALEVRNAVRAVQTNYERVQAYQLARELAAGKLEAEEKKLLVGLSTNYIVLQYQRDLADARTAELLSIIDYNLSLANLERVQGTTLKSWKIRLEDPAPDR